MRSIDSRRSVLIYIVFTVGFSSIFYFLIAKSGHSGGALVNYVGCLMWCPGLAALATCKYLGRNVSSLGWKWGNSRYQVICYLLPLAYATASYVFVWVTGFGGLLQQGVCGPYLEGPRAWTNASLAHDLSLLPVYCNH
jgi:uncharacterized protein